MIDPANMLHLVNIIVRIATTIIFLLFIIPLQVKEAEVRNGLRLLRYELLVVGIITFLINLSELLISVYKHFIGAGDFNLLTDVILTFSTLGFFFIAILKYQIYHHEYTPEQKILHARFEKIEIAAEKKARKKKKKDK